MALLPNYRQATLDIQKLSDYCLSSQHPKGKNKARVFQRVLRMSVHDAHKLKQQILSHLSHSKAQKGYSDEFGKRYIVPVIIRNLDYQAEIITIWIVRKKEDFPRFITCYVNK